MHNLVTRFIIDILQCKTYLTGAINHGAGVHTYIDHTGAVPKAPPT